VLPDGHIGLLVADTRRATQWEAGLRAAGIAALRVEAAAKDIDKGEWQIAVPRAQASAARKLVADVVNGKARLPAARLLSKNAWYALLGIAAIIVTISAVPLLCSPA